MILTINNSPPVVAPSGGGTFQLGDNITLSGQVSDYDGDILDYSWDEGATNIDFGSILTIVGGAPVNLPDHHIIGGLSLGSHVVTLSAVDTSGSGGTDSANILITVIDSEAPTLQPTVNPGILWPPNHQMVDVVIRANATDNSGSVTLTASVSSSEPPDTDGDGNTIPDFTEPVIDQDTITLQLRSERKGQGTGRIYTITVTATDGEGNSSDAVVEVVAPHDKGKK